MFSNPTSSRECPERQVRVLPRCQESKASELVLCQMRQEDRCGCQEGCPPVEQEAWEEDALLSELVQSFGIATVIMGMDAETLFSLV